MRARERANSKANHFLLASSPDSSVKVPARRLSLAAEKTVNRGGSRENHVLM